MSRMFAKGDLASHFMELTESFMLAVGLDHRIMYLSPAARRLLGVPREADCTKLDWFDSFVPQAQRDLRRTAFETLLLEKDVFQVENDILLPNGQHRNIRWSMRVSRDLDGRPDALLATGCDITENMRMQHLFRSMVEHVSDVIMLFSGEGIVLYATPSITRVLGCQPEDLALRHMHEYVHPADLESFLIGIKRAQDDPEQAFFSEFRLRHADGEYRWVEAEGRNMLHDPTLRAFLVTFRDITRKKNAVRELRESLLRYRTLVDNMSEGLMCVDADHTIQYVNPRFCEITGFSRAELIGLTSAELGADLVSQDFLRDKMQTHLLGVSDSYEMQVRAKNGELIWLHIKGYPAYNSHGAAIGSMATVSDITESKITESELKRLNAELENFVYKSSHDLKGPLASILGLIDLAQGDVQDPVAVQYIGMLHQSAQKLDGNLNDFLRTIKLRNTQPDWVEINFNALLEETLAVFKRAPGFSAMDLRLDSTADFRFSTDRDMLTSILHNLADNALKYRDPKKRGNWLSIRAMAEESGVCIVVEDNGVGISQGAQERVFDMFFRATLLSKGTGLGLYVVKNSVEKLGGIISLESAEGFGTRFVIRLPDQKDNGAVMTAVKGLKKFKILQKRRTDA